MSKFKNIVIALILSLAVVGAGNAQPAKAPAPGKVTQLMLLRSTLLALDHANQTGNYTVLRDLAGANFRRVNNPAELGQIFASIVAQKVDLAPIAIAEPRFTPAVALDAHRRLRIKGTLPRPSMVIAFDLLYEVEDRRWKLFGISISGEPVKPAPAAP